MVTNNGVRNMEFFGESSRAAAMFGVIGMVVGAFGGAFVDNILQRDREIERDLFRTRLEAVRSFLQGTSESFASSVKNDEERKYIAKINYGRMLIAVAGNDELVAAVRNWMKTEKNVPKCQNVTGPNRTYLEMRRALLGEQLGHMSDSLVGEVALRCLPK
jgi:hypothetical protein